MVEEYPGSIGLTGLSDADRKRAKPNAGQQINYLTGYLFGTSNWEDDEC